MQPLDAKQTADLLTNLFDRFRQVKKETSIILKNKSSNRPALKKTLARRAAGMADDLRRILKRWYGFYDGYDPQFSWWVHEPYDALDKELVFLAFYSYYDLLFLI